MTFNLAGAIALMMILIVGNSAAAQEGRPAGLTAAKALYASASYEDALQVLAASNNPIDFERVEQYRALCLLALGRTEEAERALERIVARSPLHRMSTADVSPRLVAAFREVRQRTLPAAAREVYTAAKASFDRKDYDQASAGFTALLAILDDADIAGHAGGLADLELVGEGFLKLIQAEIAARTAANEAVAPPEPPPAPPSTPPSPSPTQSAYSARDLDVTPPEAITRPLPLWIPPNPTVGIFEHRGLLELLIDERGAVQTAALRESVSPFYDAALLKAAAEWTYRPAVRNGEAVKYRAFVPIVLKPDEPK